MRCGETAVASLGRESQVRVTSFTRKSRSDDGGLRSLAASDRNPHRHSATP